ncbi:hypothetical protein ACJQWK_00798 [Exserohilum turcicum]
MAEADTSSPTSPPLTLYFGYGSNLWLHQMATRCPDSQYLGIALLPHYTWLINDRGYANVVSAPCPDTATSGSSRYKTSVYGLVYSLTPSDEARLDINEGVPIAYTKEYLPCSFWAATSREPGTKIDTSQPPSETNKRLLVYIDRVRTAPSTPRDEYVYRMNRGIHDALGCGVPGEYVDEVMRKYIAADDYEEEEEEEDGEDGKKKREEREKMAEFARGQAARFRDESGVFE